MDMQNLTMNELVSLLQNQLGPGVEVEVKLKVAGLPKEKPPETDSIVKDDMLPEDSEFTAKTYQSVKATSQYMGAGESTVKRWIDEGLIEAHKSGTSKNSGWKINSMSVYKFQLSF